MNKQILSLVVLCLCSSALAAQTKVVQAQYDNDGFPIPDVLYNEIIADTNAQGEQLNSVYELQSGEEYTLRTQLTVNNPITITAPELERLGNVKPPVVRVEYNSDGTSPTGGDFIWFFAGANITISNIYFSGIHTQNGWTAGNFLRPTKANITVTLENLIMDYMGWSVIANFDAAVSGVSYITNNVYIKNAQNTGDLNSPFFILNIGPALDTVVVRNMTYFQSHGFFLQSRTPINKLIIDHSTIANALKSPIYNLQFTDAQITNNIFFNVAAAGFNAAERADQDPDGLVWSIVNVDTLYNENQEIVTDRKLEVKNNVYYESPSLTSYKADSLITTEWMNSRTLAFFNDKQTYPNFVAENNVNIDPGFKNITEPGNNGENAVDEMLAYIQAFRSGDSENAGFWGYEGDLELDPFSEQAVEWPLTEDLSHTIGNQVTDDDGGPIGDQAWFFPNDQIVSSEGDAFETPSGFTLSQNYPNPFNPTTNISFTLPVATKVTLEVYNLLGQKVASLANDVSMNAGSHTLTFDASYLSSGIYMYKISASESYSQTRKMMLIK